MSGILKDHIRDSSHHYLRNIIRGRTCAVLAHGASIQELENHIVSINEMVDICWVSLGVYNVVEDFILNRINKHLDILFECSGVPEERIKNFELSVRGPRLEKFLQRDEYNLWITSHGFIRDNVKPYLSQLLNYSKKILVIDSIFPRATLKRWMDVPNSITLLTGALIAGGASKIIYFGLDGHKGDGYNHFNSYYQPHLIESERFNAFGSEYDSGINRDTYEFEKRFNKISTEYMGVFANKPKLYNCSPGTIFTVIPKINYQDLKGVLK